MEPSFQDAEHLLERRHLLAVLVFLRAAGLPCEHAVEKVEHLHCEKALISQSVSVALGCRHVVRPIVVQMFWVV